MIGKILGKRYELVEKIGEGGMGLVYKAKCHLLNRYVAVKILKPELTGDEEFINRFKKESLSAASLSHPNIVNIYDVGMEEGIYYIVMEYVKGKTLKEIIKERAPMPYYEIINICRQICLALDHAHNNNIIHRDVKPQNILITHDGIVKVADFGIARASSSATLTNTGNVIGSVYYISPEQARGGYTDEKTDIYSLGTVMYEMACAKVPFMAESPVVVALKHIQEDVKRPSELNPDIPAALEDIILKSLEKNPDSRYESSASLIKDLDRASASPNTRIWSKGEGSNDITRVIPAINDSYAVNKGRGKERYKKVHKGRIVAAVVLITIITVSTLIMYSMYIPRGKDVPVPNIIGQDEQVADRMLRAEGLTMDVIERRNSDKPVGTVLTTFPDVGVSVKQNGVVQVRVSAGPLKVKVPNVIGYVKNDALFELEKVDLKPNVIEINNETVEKDRVIKVSPDVNIEVLEDTVVDVYVSKGREINFVDVPSLEGVAEDKIEEILKQYGLELGEVEYKRDPTKPDNVVIFQYIPYKTSVKPGTAVKVIVNKLSSSIPATY